MLTIEEIDEKINDLQRKLETMTIEYHSGKLNAENYYRFATSSYAIITHLNELRVLKLRKMTGTDR